MQSMHEGHRARLRDSALKSNDLESFSEYQTLELILSFVIPRKDTNPIAHELIQKFGDLYGVLHAEFEELSAVKNMTVNAAMLLKFFYAIYRKSEQCNVKKLQRAPLRKISDAVEYLIPFFAGRTEEHSYCIAMDLNDRILQAAEISNGTADSTVLDNTKILAIVTRTKAKKIILAHNHPSGSLIPSEQDIILTSSLFFTLQTVGSFLCDHIIISGDKYFSFYQNKLLDENYMRFDRLYGTNVSEKLQAKRDSGIYANESPMDEDV